MILSKTEYLMLEEDTILPSEFIIDYNRMWKKSVLNVLDTLSELENLGIPQIISENKSLFEYVK